MNDQQDIEQQIGQRLREQQIDDATRQRLRESRRLALNSLDGASRPIFTPLARAGLAFAGIGALALLLMLGLNRQASPPESDSLIAFEIVTSGAPLEFYEELEFYDWLADQQQDQG